MTITADKIRVKVLEILNNSAIGGLWQLAATGTLNGGTATYKKPERIIVEDWKVDGSSTVQEGKVVDIDITMDKKVGAKYELETLDLATQELADAEEGVIAGSLVSGLHGYLDAEFLKHAISIDASPTGEPTINTASTDDQLGKNFLAMQDAVSNFEGLVDNAILGIERVSMLQIVSPYVYTRLIAYLKQYTGEGLAMTMSGRLTGRDMGGSMVIRHPFLGKAYGAGKLHKTNAYDFSKTHAVIIHSEAVAMPVNHQPKIMIMPNKDTLNYQVGLKMQYGIGTLRPYVKVFNNA